MKPMNAFRCTGSVLLLSQRRISSLTSLLLPPLTKRTRPVLTIARRALPWRRSRHSFSILAIDSGRTFRPAAFGPQRRTWSWPTSAAICRRVSAIRSISPTTAEATLAKVASPLVAWASAAGWRVIATAATAVFAFAPTACGTVAKLWWYEASRPRRFL